MSAADVTAELAGGGKVLFSRRSDGNMSSVGGLGHEHGHRSRERLRERVGAAQLARGYQVHGTVVRRWREMPEPAPPGMRPQDADGQASCVQGLVPMVLGADCLAVALGCTGAVAMVHAGWRGLAAGVLEEGIAALRELAPAGAPIGAVIGPGAGLCCYEVGPEVHLALGGHNSGRANIDLHAIAGERLRAAGASEVLDLGLCTICDERFFSHRREGAAAGRMAGVAWLS
jgi:YfiH family protein